MRGISLADLMGAGLLRDGTVLVHRGHRGKHSRTFRGVMRKPGQIEIEVDGRKKLFNNPSAAATAFTGGACNGWEWWSVLRDDGREQRLSEFRSKVTQ